MNEHPTPPADPARGRFWLIQLTRLSGIVFMLAGLAVLTGKVDLPRAAGVVLLLVGVAEAFIAPILLARQWQSPRQ